MIELAVGPGQAGPPKPESGRRPIQSFKVITHPLSSQASPTVSTHFLSACSTYYTISGSPASPYHSPLQITVARVILNSAEMKLAPTLALLAIGTSTLARSAIDLHAEHLLTRQAKPVDLLAILALC